MQRWKEDSGDVRSGLEMAGDGKDHQGNER
jgi:hypothetical protein